MSIETHPFGYFLPAFPKTLILGSFPCFNGTDYGDWFYSGSGKNHFWKLLSDIFEMPANTLEEKKSLCEKHGLALTDIAHKIERKKGNCSDSNLRIVEINKEAIERCLASEIEKILFTSRFVERHFLRHFPKVKVPSGILVSPSPAANIHIAGLAEYKQLRADEIVVSPYEYRLLKYRELLMQ
ncbi:hypothetical protein V6R21_10490 [Limibacter armeniacum]|uniref:hypothetical protein n=1 Tax=Limibacter armeniacum TaxID=466084 RepID=UPI002FE60D94